MPAMANITVKKADGTTDIVFDQVSGSPGDSGMAQWRQDTGANAALPQGQRAVLLMGTKFNGPRTARRVHLSFVRPYSVLNTSTGRYEAKDRAVGELTLTLPQEVPVGELAEAAHQFLNLAGALLIRQSAAAGYAPT